jgi:hypothetical protein
MLTLPSRFLTADIDLQQSRAVAYCWQPASTVTLGIEPRWDPWPYICSVSRLLPPLLKLFWFSAIMSQYITFNFNIKLAQKYKEA